MASVLNSKLGKIYLLETNPRTIRESAFNTLCESIERDENFLRMRGIIVWQVPHDYKAPEGIKDPFEGQKGKVVILGGNMRAKALKALGHTDLKPEWIVEAKNPDGSWISPEEAERLVLIDNGSVGIAGMNDYEKLLEEFNETIMRQSGIDFSEFQSLIGKDDTDPIDSPDEDGETPEEKVEKDEQFGEKNEELEYFISERERTRRNLKEIDDTGFYMVLVFEEGSTEKQEFIAKSKAFKGKVVSPDLSPYLVLVFENYDQKMAFADAIGLNEEDPETGVPPLMFGMFCDGREFAKKMGIELKETGLHFRERIVDKQLAEMTMPPLKQKSEKEIQEEIYAQLKSERKGLGMSTRSAGERRDKEENVDES